MDNTNVILNSNDVSEYLKISPNGLEVSKSVFDLEVLLRRSSERLQSYWKETSDIAYYQFSTKLYNPRMMNILQTFIV